jgi:hypothetical protein
LIEVYKSDEFPDPLDRGQSLPVSDCGGLLIVHFKPITADVHTQELNFRLMELALLWVAEQFGLLETLESVPDTWYMHGMAQVVVESIIQIVLKVLVQEWGEDPVHVPLQAWWHVCEAKSHYMELEGAKRSHECGLPFILGLDADLIVTKL